MSKEKRHRATSSPGTSQKSPKKQRVLRVLEIEDKLEIFRAYLSYIEGMNRQLARNRIGSAQSAPNSKYYREAYNLLPAKYQSLAWSTYKRIIHAGNLNPSDPFFRKIGSPLTLPPR